MEDWNKDSRWREDKPRRWEEAVDTTHARGSVAVSHARIRRAGTRSCVKEEVLHKTLHTSTKEDLHEAEEEVHVGGDDDDCRASHTEPDDGAKLDTANSRSPESEDRRRKTAEDRQGEKQTIQFVG